MSGGPGFSRNEGLFIALSTDRRYLPFLGVTLSSLLRRTKHSFRIFVISTDLEPSDRLKLDTLVMDTPSRIEYLVPDRSSYSDLRLTGYTTIAAYDRMFLADILPPEVHRVLYLDCDLLVLGDVAEIWETDITGYALAAVDDAGFNNFDRLEIPRKSGYFNSGVMLMNLDFWRRENLSVQAVEFSRRHRARHTHHDQCTLNGVLTGKWARLDCRWNVHLAMLKRGSSDKVSRNAITRAIRNPGIIHFTTRQKPWMPGTVHYWRREYMGELGRTPWRGWRPDERPGQGQVLGVLGKLPHLMRIWMIRHGVPSFVV